MKAYTFHSFVCLLFILSGGLLGVSLSLIYFNPDFALSISEAMQKNPRNFLVVGGILTSFSALLFILFYSFNKKSCYQVQIGAELKVSVNKKILSDYLSQFFQEEMPERRFDFRLNINKQNLEILADLSHIPLEEHESLFTAIEPKLEKQLANRFGLPNRVIFSLFCKEF